MISALRLAIAWITLFAIGTDLFVVSPLLPLLAKDFGVTARGAGLAVTTFSLGYVVAAPVFGHLADRLGRRRVLACCLAGFAAGNALTAEAGSLPAMMAIRLLCGIAAAGVTPSIYVLTGGAAPAGRRGTWIAIVLTGLLSSLPLGAPIGEIAALTMGWPVVFFCLAACAVLLVPAHVLLWPAGMPALVTGAPQPDGLRLIGLAQRLIPTVLWATSLYSMYTYLAAGLGSLGYDPGAIAETVFIYGAAAFAGALLGGRIADRVGPSAAIRISLIGLAFCFLLLLLAVRQWAFTALALAITSLVAQVFFPAQQSLLIGEFPTRNATALSWNNSALFLGMALGSLVGGQAMALGGFPAIMPVSALMAIAGWASFDRWLPKLRAASTT